MKHQPDTQEKVIRFGCGALIGTLFGISVSLWWFDFTSKRTILCIAAGIVISGYLAMRLGDRYWESLSKWLWWFP